MTDRINASRTHVRTFGITFAVLLGVVSAYLAYTQSDAWLWTAGASVAFLCGGLFAHPVLRPIYIGWMKFAFALAWVNTRILLGLFFYIVITPVGLVLRLLGKDLLGEKIDRSEQSYWTRREQVPFDPKRYERLF